MVTIDMSVDIVEFNLVPDKTFLSSWRRSAGKSAVVARNQVQVYTRGVHVIFVVCGVRS